MNFGEILLECGELGNTSSRVNQEWRRFVNRAQRRIAQRRDWNFCHDVRTVTIKSGQLSSPLDKNFKKLANEKSPISYQDPTVPFPLPIPVEVISRAQADRMGYNPWTTPFPTAPVCFSLRYVFLEQNGPNGQWMLYLPVQAIANPTAVYTVSAYYYPSDLQNADDHNGMTDHPELGDALINLTKGMAYFAEDSTSPQGVACMEEYEKCYRRASYSDCQQRFGGRPLMM